MRRDPESRKRNMIKVMWLMILLSATLLMPSAVSGKYKSRFSRTVDIVVTPSLTADGVPADGILINNIYIIDSDNETLTDTATIVIPDTDIDAIGADGIESACADNEECSTDHPDMPTISTNSETGSDIDIFLPFEATGSESSCVID